MPSKLKSSRQMGRYIKGISNHHRIDILLTIAENKNIRLNEICDILDANEKTIGEHTRRLYQAGLINKKYIGKFVEHYLSPYGMFFVKFLREFQKM